MFSAYFISHCLSMFYVEKQVSEFLATHSGDLQIARPSHKFWLLILVTCKPRVHTEWFRDSFATQLTTRQLRNS